MTWFLLLMESPFPLLNFKGNKQHQISDTLYLVQINDICNYQKCFLYFLFFEEDLFELARIRMISIFRITIQKFSKHISSKTLI